jgi:hypothetical protein
MPLLEAESRGGAGGSTQIKHRSVSCSRAQGPHHEGSGNLAELRLLAVLATYRRDGRVLLSPVWDQWRDGGFGVVTAAM